jgi:hypothetical protein
MDKRKRAQKLIDEMLVIADNESTPIERAKLRIRARLVALQAVLREPRTLKESADWWEELDG